MLVADGHALVRAGLRALLEAGGIGVVGEAASGEEAVAAAQARRPDVVVLDGMLPGLDGREVTRRTTAVSDVLFLARSDADEQIFGVLRAGARGLLLKDAEPAEMLRAVAALARGDAMLSPALARRVIAELASRPEPLYPSAERLEQLTARERQVVQLVGLGLSNDAIARRLVISRTTAKTHVSRAMVKLGARDRAAVVILAYETGLVTARAA